MHLARIAELVDNVMLFIYLELIFISLGIRQQCEKLLNIFRLSEKIFCESTKIKLSTTKSPSNIFVQFATEILIFKKSQKISVSNTLDFRDLQEKRDFGPKSFIIFAQKSQIFVFCDWFFHLGQVPDNDFFLAKKLKFGGQKELQKCRKTLILRTSA